jgi:hypothetical protein
VLLSHFKSSVAKQKEFQTVTMFFDNGKFDVTLTWCLPRELSECDSLHLDTAKLNRNLQSWALDSRLTRYCMPLCHDG